MYYIKSSALFGALDFRLLSDTLHVTFSSYGTAVARQRGATARRQFDIGVHGSTVRSGGLRRARAERFGPGSGPAARFARRAFP